MRQASMQPETALPVGGTWVWELRSIDAEGDERNEREEWHLTETADGVGGYYDRTVARMRGDGSSFTCNNQPRYETTTRYNVSGQRFGDKLTLTETDYQRHAQPLRQRAAPPRQLPGPRRRPRQPHPVVGSRQSAPAPQEVARRKPACTGRTPNIRQH